MKCYYYLLVCTTIGDIVQALLFKAPKAIKYIGSFEGDVDVDRDLRDLHKDKTCQLLNGIPHLLEDCNEYFTS